MNGALLLLRLLLSAVFGLAGIGKLADPGGTKQSLADFGAPGFLVAPLTTLLPAIELLCAATLLPVATARWGAVCASVLLLVFIVVIVVSLVRGRRPDCHCFGQMHSSPVGASTLIRNSVLLAASGLVIFHAPDEPAPSYLGWFGSLTPLDVVTIALVVLGGLWGWSLYHLLRQNGRLLLRLEAVEEKLGLNTLAEPGLPVNAAAPPFRLTALDGPAVTLEALLKARHRLLLIFTEPECNPCDALMPEVGRWQNEYAERLSVVLISRGGADAHRAKALRHGLSNILLQSDRETANAYRADGTPSAVLVRDGKIASPLAAGADAIRALVALATVPDPLAPGQPDPALVLPDLDGNPINLRDFRGQLTLLLFWNPSCGFCQEMLPDMTAWERTRTDSAPRLLVVSTGDAETNRAQGFLSPVLLDQKFEAGQLFGAQGTPAAVLLDSDARVASGVRVGAVEVLGLAREAAKSIA